MIGEKNATEGAAFLAENKKKEGVKVLPSGLQYKVIKEGDRQDTQGDRYGRYSVQGDNDRWQGVRQLVQTE